MTDQEFHFRQQVLRVKEYECEQCHKIATDEASLHIHSKGYHEDKELWEYDIDEVRVLCESCHQRLHARVNEFGGLLSFYEELALSDMLWAIGLFASIHWKYHEHIAEKAYAFLSNFRDQFRGDEQQQYRQTYILTNDVKNLLLGLSEATLDCLLDGLEIAKNFSAEHQRKSATELYAFIVKERNDIENTLVQEEEQRMY